MPPTAPTLEAPAYVTAGGSYQAKVRVPIWSSTYAWTIEGGTLSADAGDSVIVTAGSSGTVIVSCVENRSGVSSPAGTATTVVVPPPAKPDITAPVLVTVGRAGPVASVEHQGNSTYSWTIEGGKITSGATGPSIAFEAMTTGPIKLNCTVTNIVGDSAEGTKEVTSILSAAAPIITAPPAVTGGEEAVAEVEGQPGTTFSWKIDGGEFDEGVDDTSIRFRATSSVPVTLTCTAWNEAGDGTEGVKIVVVFSVPFPDTPVVSRRRSRRVDITPAC